MRVYQFRHIRAGGQCSRSHNTALRRLTYHDRLGAASLDRFALPPRARDRIGAGRATRSSWRARRGDRRAEPEAARDDQVARGPRPADTDDGRCPGERRARHRVDDPELSDPLALPPRRERHGRRRPPFSARAARRAAGRRARLPERALPASARSQLAADRRAGTVGRRARERRSGDEDRDHRRGDRPDASLLQPRGLHDACRLSEGAGCLHDREGDRRARLSRRRSRSGSTPGSPSIPSSRRTARTSRASPRATPTRRRTATGSPASRHAPTSATTRR